MHAAARAAAERAAAVVASKFSSVHLIYTSQPTWPFTSNNRQAALDIAVLDSSFNPPSKAHLALLTSKPLLAQHKSHYDGHLLLFSTQNADKGTGKPGDASLEQRATMMTLMAKLMEREGHTSNVAVGLVDKPLIFDKSTLTCDLLRSQTDNNDMNGSRLHWVVGIDTLYRVFQLKYYPSPETFHAQCKHFFEEERTTFVCARRDPSSYASQSATEAKEEQDRLLQSDNVKPWLDAGCIAMLDLDPDQAALSSTKIRAHLTNADATDDDKKQALRHLVPPVLVDYLVSAKVYC